MKHKQPTQGAVRLFAALLRLYPRGFRRDYDEPLQQAFRDGWRDAQRRDRLASFWLSTLADMLRSAFAERMSQMMNPRWWLTVLKFTAASVAYFLSWLFLVISMVIVTYFMLVPWDEGTAPGTLAGAVNDLFSSNLIVLPAMLISAFEVIAISRLTHRRLYHPISIYWRFTAVNVIVTVLSLAVTQLLKIVIGRLYPDLDIWVIDPRYGETVICCGLIILGVSLAYFARLAWRPPTMLPLARKPLAAR
jgi:hypothetical protein